MSHFTVLVIGDNPETQLEAFDENLQVDEYSNEIPQDEIDDFMAYYERGGKNPTNKSFPDRYSERGKDWNSSSWRFDPETNTWKTYSTYNPKSKWDWYELGGRWTGFLKMKKGRKGAVGRPGIMTEGAKEGFCDQAMLKDIDFEGMRDIDGENAKKEYLKVQKIFGGKIPRLEYKWSDLMGERVPMVGLTTIDEKRDYYHNQPPMAIVKANRRKLGHFFNLEDYEMTIDEFVKVAKDNAISTFAVVKNGEWFEKGQMGWFGMASNEKEQTNWSQEIENFLSDIPKDTLISIFDCHI